ncbi:MAG: spore coat protein CotJB [Eubacteriales bacterium]
MVRNNPINNPNENPMSSPINNPKENPMLSPINNPKENPMLSPINNPKENPMLSPINNPKENPMLSPINNPKENPMLSPISNPKENPMLSPISNPKENPMLSPISKPIKKPMPNVPGEVAGAMIAEIMKYQFAVYDLALYLDTHPNDIRAKIVRKEYAETLHQLVMEYEEMHGPLTLLSPHGDYTKYVNQPWPWEIRF